MRKSLHVSLIVCVALLTQLGASFWAAAMARDGYAGCERRIEFAPLNSTADDNKGVPADAPTPHDHTSCSMCQGGFDVIVGEAPVLPPRAIEQYWPVAFSSIEAPPLRSSINRSAAARAPPPSQA